MRVVLRSTRIIWQLNIMCVHIIIRQRTAAFYFYHVHYIQLHASGCCFHRAARGNHCTIFTLFCCATFVIIFKPLLAHVLVGMLSLGYFRPHFAFARCHSFGAATNVDSYQVLAHAACLRSFVRPPRSEQHFSNETPIICNP